LDASIKSQRTDTASPLVEEENARLQKILKQVDIMVEKWAALPKEFSEDRNEPQTADEVASLAVDRIRERQLEDLRVVAREPYFGRLDFQEDGSLRPEVFYIGKRGLKAPETGEQLIMDWRAPAASLFYSASGQSKNSYNAPQGIIEGTVHRKRNIVVRERVLERVVDSYVLGEDFLGVKDEFLLYRLQEGRDHRLRDIVSTIQSEQDAIIRAPRQSAIVIQGVAGSGKTTVALHRLAYLIYQHPEQLDTRRMVIFAPSEMFVDYISEVLPELGVGGIQQTTFAAFAWTQLSGVVRRTDDVKHLPKPPDGHEAEWDGKMDVVFAKSRASFLRQIDAVVQEIEQRAVPQIDFEPWAGTILSYNEVHTWFTVDYARYPLAHRIERTLGRIKRWADIQYRAKRDDDVGKAVRKQAQSRLRSYSKLWPQISLMELYQSAQPMAWVSQRRDGKPGSKSLPVVATEDLAPLLYLQALLYGIRPDATFQHVVLDEAQDVSPAQMQVLRLYCPSDSFTILGDLAQSIHTQSGIEQWSEFLDLFPVEKAMQFSLAVSYRSTMEIIEVANRSLKAYPDLPQATPVYRSGEPVMERHVEETDRLSEAVREVMRLHSCGCRTLAVLCQSEWDVRPYADAMQQAGLVTHAITAEHHAYEGGISVLPVSMAKGLEFDGVVLVDADAPRYPLTKRNAKLLYVACTRALHHLAVLYSGEETPLLRP
jgi:DNA helicase-2/ATP-dependent DNA helicase PcrA